MRSRVALLVIPALLLAMLPGAASASPGQSERARHNEVVAFWTADRMKAAVSRDIVFDPVRGFQPAAKPPGTPGGGGGGGGGNEGGPPIADVTGASWPNGVGDIYRGEGKVFFRLSSGLYVCSGTPVVDSRTGHSMVLTAGHCAIDKGRFATMWMFVPQYDSHPVSYTDCANTAYGCWTASALFVHSNFAKQKQFNNTAVIHDYAFAVLGPGGKSGTQLLENAVGGAFGITFGGPAVGTVLSAYGYPAASPYNGLDLTYCKGGIGTDPNTSNATWAMVCNMTGGSSGGGWLDGDWTSYGGAKLRSLNSYGYSGVNNMYGPKFDSRTQAVYSAANTGPLANTAVSGG